MDSLYGKPVLIQDFLVLRCKHLHPYHDAHKSPVNVKGTYTSASRASSYTQKWVSLAQQQRLDNKLIPWRHNSIYIQQRLPSTEQAEQQCIGNVAKTIALSS